MPGYLVKTANFVAEIGNDEELMKLAEVDTVKKDTQIRILPQKEWIFAKNIPILRKLWKLDATENVPPLTKISGGICAPAPAARPPRLETVIDSKDEIAARLAAQAKQLGNADETVTRIHKDAKLDVQDYAFEMQATQPLRLGSGETKTVLRVKSQNFSENAQIAAAVSNVIRECDVSGRNADATPDCAGSDEENTQKAGIGIIAVDELISTPGHKNAEDSDNCKPDDDNSSPAVSDEPNLHDACGGENACDSDADRSDCPDGIDPDSLPPFDISADDPALPNPEDESRTRPDGFFADPLGAPANESIPPAPAGSAPRPDARGGDAQTRAECMPDPPAPACSAPRTDARGGDAQTRAESLLMRMRELASMGDDEYIEAAPDEATYVMESSLVRECMAAKADEEKNAAAKTRDGHFLTDCPSIEISLDVPFNASNLPADSEHQSLKNSAPGMQSSSPGRAPDPAGSEKQHLFSDARRAVQTPDADHIDLSESVLESDVLDFRDFGRHQSMSDELSAFAGIRPEQNGENDADDATAEKRRPSGANLGGGGGKTASRVPLRAKKRTAKRPDAANRSRAKTSDKEIEAARSAVNAARQFAAECGQNVDSNILRCASRLIDALEEAQRAGDAAENMPARTSAGQKSIKRAAGGENDACIIPEQSQSREEDEDDSPSEAFKIRKASDFLPDILKPRSGKPDGEKTPAASCGDDALSEIEEHSDALKIQNTRALRRMLRAEARAAATKSELPKAPGQDLSANDGLRSLFEKEDELHLYLANEIREQESKAERETAADQENEEPEPPQELSKKSELRRKLRTIQSMTDEMPVTNERAVIRQSPARKEKTKVVAKPGFAARFSVAKGDAPLSFDDPFFRERLMDDETPIASFGSFFLTSRRIWNISGGRSRRFRNCEVFDIENIQGLALQEDNNRAWIIADIAFIAVLTAYYVLAARYSAHSLITLMVILYGIVMLPVCYFLSFYTTLRISVGAAVLKCKCRISRQNRSEALAFLKKIENARIERRKSNQN